MKKTSVIKNFLTINTHADLADLYNHDMECQVNVAADGGQSIESEYKGRSWRGWTDGITTWKPFRIPLNANNNPSFDDSEILWDFDSHVEAIGMTGWDWVNRLSRWVAFDLDAILGHKASHTKKLSPEEMDRARITALSVPWITIRKSTSGKGLHLYAMLDPVETETHTEHAALARSVLGTLSAITGYDFDTRVDVCVPGKTWIMTSDGPRQVKDLIHNPFIAVVDGQPFQASGFFKTKEDIVYEIITKEGYKVQATKEHLFGTADYRWVSIQNMKSGDKLKLNKHSNLSWGGEGDWNEGYILGWLFGDGYFNAKRSTKHRLLIFANDFCLLEYICSLFHNRPNVYFDEKQNCYYLESEELEQLRVKFGLNSKKEITEDLESASSAFISGFISAIFDTDGTAAKDCSRAILSQSDLPRLEAIQRMLQRFGIFSRIYLSKEAGTKNIQGISCKTKKQYNLTIGRETLQKFHELCEFKHPVKRKILESFQSKKQKLQKEHFEVEVKEVREIGIKSVYDVKVERRHAFDANGFVAHNCGGNTWVWARRMIGTDGLSLVKPATELFDPPPNWKEHIPVITGIRRKIRPFFVEDKPETEISFEELTAQTTKIALDESHRKLIDWLGNRAWWDFDHKLLVTHTFALKEAHERLGLRGIYDTIAQGREAGDYNCFMHALPNGAWSIRRYTPGVAEAKTWSQDGQGWTQCYYNRDATLDVVSKVNDGVEHERGGFVFKEAALAEDAILKLGASLDLPAWIRSRSARVKPHKDSKRLVVEIDKREDDPPFPGWLSENKKWRRIFSTRIPPLIPPETRSYDAVVRHLVMSGVDFGWMLKSPEGHWVKEPITHVGPALESLGLPPKEAKNIVGSSVIKHWTLVTEPFKEEYLGDRIWNLNAPKLAMVPSTDLDNLKYPTWNKVLRHCGKGLDLAIKSNPWAVVNGITTGADYLKCWIASMIKEPFEPLPYLFFHGNSNIGKSSFHESICLLMTRGWMDAGLAITNQSGFNAELLNVVLCYIEEVNLNQNKMAYNHIKHWVTAREILFHEKRKTPILIKNTTKWIQTANDSSHCPIFPGDTRITMIEVPDLEPGEMIPKKDLFPLLQKEIPDFLAAVLALELPPSGDRLNIPVIMTESKRQAETSNRTILEAFVAEKCFYCPGSMMEFSEFYEKFIEWVEPAYQSEWTKIKVGRSIPSTFAVGRRPRDNQKVIGNISFLQPQPEQLRAAKYYVQDGFLKMEVRS